MGIFLKDYIYRQIEHKYIDIDAQGFFAKVTLNQLGIDTSKKSKNKGKCAGHDPKMVANNLLDAGLLPHKFLNEQLLIASSLE